MKKFLLFILCVSVQLQSIASVLDLSSNLSRVDTTIEQYLDSHHIKAVKAKEGYYLSTELEGGGVKPKLGDFIKMKFTTKLLSGKKVDESVSAQGFIFQVGYRQVILALDVAVQQIKVGSKSTLFIPADLAYGDSPPNAEIPNNAPLLLEIELIEVLSQTGYDNYIKEVENQERLAFEAKIASQFESDKKGISEYVASKKMKVIKLSSGVSYQITKNGKGDLPKKGTDISIGYEGSFTNGKIFDSTKGKKAFEFELGGGKVIDGLDEALRFFNKGSEGVIIIPSKLGYGATPLDDGKTSVPGNSILIFRVVVN
jgi:FKBP-type peptidyl-prolyl cis-trans isomerase